MFQREDNNLVDRRSKNCPKTDKRCWTTGTLAKKLRNYVFPILVLFQTQPCTVFVRYRRQSSGAAGILSCEWLFTLGGLLISGKSLLFRNSIGLRYVSRNCKQVWGPSIKYDYWLWKCIAVRGTTCFTFHYLSRVKLSLQSLYPTAGLNSRLTKICMTRENYLSRRG